MNSLCMSYPATLFTALLPHFTISPSAVTTVNPNTQSRNVPTADAPGIYLFAASSSPSTRSTPMDDSEKSQIQRPPLKGVPIGIACPCCFNTLLSSETDVAEFTQTVWSR